MSDVPARVTITEEGPREGFQSEPPGIATEAKIRLVEALAETGVTRITCASFVDARRLPQMADAEAIAAGIRRRAGVAYTGLWLNEKGFRRAEASGLDLDPLIVGSASDTFLMRNNNRTPEASLADQRRMLEVYADAGLSPGPIYLFTAFGCNYEGDVPVAKVVACTDSLIGLYDERGIAPSALYLCDTVGAANPMLVSTIVGAIRERWPSLEIALHLHDTRGIGMANVLAGLQMGVARFDASVGGLGGCPFAGNRAAAGNIATEDLVFLCEEMGIQTGIDLEALIEAARLAEGIVCHPLPGRVMKAGSLARFRHAEMRQ
ncbi:hydroxymethylglutaryl-CoA lyase [Rhodoligotrophos appendicifer]|uniref:hydroxymethylglutaryl-CoA lyase n=1 Tax=Rhodoligotrophos appendicifer TaxID=987056 RepID=UPI001180E8F6|nr:hydroxymethylglutaryl-CoA lyase [Rhodoligotrophos appendicifer]